MSAKICAAGRVGPLALVFPGISGDDNRIPGMLVNMCAPHLANGATGIGSGRFTDVFFDDLIPYIDTSRSFPKEGRGASSAFRSAALWRYRLWRGDPICLPAPARMMAHSCTPATGGGVCVAVTG